MIDNVGGTYNRTNEMKPHLAVGLRSGSSALSPKSFKSSNSSSNVASKNTPTPKFGGLPLVEMYHGLGTKLVNVGLPVFENVSEVFLWGFLAQDVVSMWMPRIRQSLMRGAIPYDPTKDPENKGKTWFQTLKTTMANRIAGWNWVNFNEETKREFATGPGVLMIPALAFLAARRSFGKSSVELGHGPLTQFTDSFIQALKNSPLATQEKITPQEFQQVLGDFVKSTFGFSEADLAQKIKISTGKELKVRAGEVAAKSETTLGEYLTQWSHQWAESVFNHHGIPQADLKKEIHVLETSLQDTLISGFNRAIKVAERPDKVLNIDKIPVKLLDRTLSKGPNAEKIVYSIGEKPVGEFLHELSCWKDYALAVFSTKTKGAGVSDFLPELAEKIYKKMVTKKAMLALAVSGLTGFYLIELAKWAQSHETYEANRLLQEPQTSPAQELKPVLTTKETVKRPVTKPSQSSDSFQLPPELLKALSSIPETPSQNSTESSFKTQPASQPKDWTQTIGPNQVNNFPIVNFPPFPTTYTPSFSASASTSAQPSVYGPSLPNLMDYQQNFFPGFNQPYASPNLYGIGSQPWGGRVS
ncbi:MAG: hypothetical protein K2X66_13250 [Cyanobacteria bacterium]|nr:hypothetical protein [Cyanobacteriota bacterium]